MPSNFAMPMESITGNLSLGLIRQAKLSGWSIFFFIFEIQMYINPVNTFKRKVLAWSQTQWNVFLLTILQNLVHLVSELNDWTLLEMTEYLNKVFGLILASLASILLAICEISPQNATSHYIPELCLEIKAFYEYFLKLVGISRLPMSTFWIL